MSLSWRTNNAETLQITRVSPPGKNFKDVQIEPSVEGFGLYATRAHRLKSFEGLPEGFYHRLFVFSSKLKDFSYIPKRLGWVRVSDGILSSFRGLTYEHTIDRLDCNNQEQLSSFEGLEASINKLQCEGTNISSLRFIPQTLTHLNLSYTDLDSLIGIPPTLKVLILKQTLVTSLEGLSEGLIQLKISPELRSLEYLPSSVEILIVDDNLGLTSLTPVPKNLKRLCCRNTSVTMTPPEMRDTKLMQLRYEGPLSLANLPPTVRVLYVVGKKDKPVFLNLPKGLPILFLCLRMMKPSHFAEMATHDFSSINTIYCLSPLPEPSFLQRFKTLKHLLWSGMPDEESLDKILYNLPYALKDFKARSWQTHIISSLNDKLALMQNKRKIDEWYRARNCLIKTFLFARLRGLQKGFV